ncbi:RES family NAD+ phosphorylase [Hansschlegelia zhihuaiae]|uniref:RES family NAD+ phosphorylase n=1 Tax=Hansschlegelia zhihuaiae TaxID=405005 RepID=UPI0013E8D590|nr:RES family NAD+ phosphorylase [Hansschlegelia zhihuaiae]
MIPEIEFVEGRTVRLIPTAYIDEPAVRPLADDEDEEAILNELEGLTSARLSSAALPVGVDPAELLNESYGYGWTFINAAFCHAKPPGNRFNDEDRGCWYAAFGERDAETAEAEVTFHMADALREAGASQELVSYGQFLAGFSCRFHDLRGEAGHASLDPDRAIGYPAGQALARSIRALGGNGVLYPSVRFAGGMCLAAFRPSVIQNVRRADQVSFEWDGVRMTKIP